jgi:hypothetical protein
VEDFGVLLEEAEKGRGVELAEAAEEGAVGDEAAEGDASGGGADEVGWVGQAAQDVQRELVGDGQRGELMASVDEYLALIFRAAAHPAAA